MRSFFKQLFSILVVAAFLNSHILGPAWAVGGREEPLREHLLAPHFPSSLHLEHDTEQGPSALLRGFVLLPSSSFDPTTIPPDIHLLPIPHLEDADIKHSWSRKAQLASEVGAVILGGMAACAGGLMFMTSSPIIGLIIGPDAEIPPVPVSLICATTVAGLALAPTAIRALYEELTEAKLYFSHKKGAHGHKKSFRGWGYWTLAGGTVFALTSKALYEYVQVNVNPSPPPLVTAAAVLVGIPYFLWRIMEEGYEPFARGWNLLTQPSYAGSGPAKQALHDRLSAGLRKAQAESAAARDLHQAWHEVDAARRVHLASLRGQKNEKDYICVVTATAHLAKMRALYVLAEGEATYVTPAAAKAKPKGWWEQAKRFVCGDGDHPWYYTGAKIAGMVCFAPIVYAQYYSWLEVFGETFEDWEGPSLTFASTASAIGYSVYLINAVGDQVQRLVAYATGYNPSKGNPEVGEASSYGGRGAKWRTTRFFTEVLDWLRKTYYMLPIGLIAGEGMFDEDIPMKKQLFFLVLNCLAFGALEESKLQEFVTKAAGHGPEEWAAEEYEAAAGFVRGLSDEEAEELLAWMDTDFARWEAKLKDPEGQSHTVDPGDLTSPDEESGIRSPEARGQASRPQSPSPHSSSGSSHKGSPPQRETIPMTPATAWGAESSEGAAAARADSTGMWCDSLVGNGQYYVGGPAPAQDSSTVPAVAVATSLGDLHGPTAARALAKLARKPGEGDAAATADEPPVAFEGDCEAIPPAHSSIIPRARSWKGGITYGMVEEEPDESLLQGDLPLVGKRGSSRHGATAVEVVSQGQLQQAASRKPLGEPTKPPSAQEQFFLNPTFSDPGEGDPSRETEALLLDVAAELPGMAQSADPHREETASQVSGESDETTGSTGSTGSKGQKKKKKKRAAAERTLPDSQNPYSVLGLR